MVFVKSHILSRRLNDWKAPSNIRIIPFETNLRKEKCLVASIYNAPSQKNKYQLTNINASFQKTPIQDGHFQSCWRMGDQTGPLPKICHTNPTIMNIGTVIPYLKKIQKYVNHVTLYENIWTRWVLLTSAFIHWKSANFVISRNIDIDCILVHDFYFLNFFWVFKDFFDKLGYNFDDVSKNCYPRPS